MRIGWLIASSLVGVSLASGALAAPADGVEACIKRSTTPQDSATMAKYVFFTVGANPAVAAYTHISEADRQELDREVAEMTTRLVTKDCRAEIKATVAADGPAGFRNAFQRAYAAMGERSMQIMLGDPAVQQAGSGAVRYLDLNKIRDELAKP